MFSRIMLVMSLLVVLSSGESLAAKAAGDWKQWPSHPGSEIPRMSAKQIQELMFSGEKVFLVYSGYKTDRVMCGSVYIPYTMTPPNADGSMVNPKFPKDAWIACYCP